MGARKGQNNFRDHQRKAVEDGLRLVERVLKALPRGTRYADFNALKRAVAQGTGLHATTLARNPHYRKALYQFIVANPGRIDGPTEEAAPRATLKAQAVAAEIRVRAAQRDLQRLRRFVEQQPAFPAPGTVDAIGHAPGAGTQAEFDMTATVLARLLARLAEKELGIVVDMERGEIVDAAEDGSRRVIAGKPDTGPFIEWMRRQEARRRALDEEAT
ncbi:MAG TPA: hypothetical protein VIL09_07155 [Microvirga sp.]